MNNINIKNIFAKNSNDIANANSDAINIINIVKTNPINLVTDEFIVNKIKINKTVEDDKTNELYNVKYNECLLKINDAIDLNLTDIFYKIPKSFFGYKNYNSNKCLELIQKKLRKKNFETLIYSDNSIFISWAGIGTK